MAILSRGAWGNGLFLIPNGFFGVGSIPGGSPFLFFLVGAQIIKSKCCALFAHFSVYKGILSIFNGRVWFYWNCQWDMCCGWLIIGAVALWICGCLKLWFILIDGILLLWRKAIDVWVVVMCISSHHLPESGGLLLSTGFFSEERRTTYELWWLMHIPTLFERLQIQWENAFFPL